MLTFALPRLLFGTPPSGGGDGGRPRSAFLIRRADASETANTPDAAREIPTIAGIPQAELLARLRSDDLAIAQRAWETAYTEFFSRLWRMAYRTVRSREVAEEIVQDVFLTIWEQRTSLVIRDKLSLYLYVAVRNALHNHRRHVKVADRYVTAAEQAAAVTPSVVPSVALNGMVANPEDALANTEAERALLAVLDGVSERDREILLLRWRDGWSFAEIGRALGISSIAARVAVSRQQRRLRPLLEQLRQELRES